MTFEWGKLLDRGGEELTACASLGYAGSTISNATLLLLLVVSEKSRHAEEVCGFWEKVFNCRLKWFCFVLIRTLMRLIDE